MYIVTLTPKAKKQLDQLDNRYIPAFWKVLDRLQKNPHLGKPLTGKFKGQWRHRFSQYRILYRVFENKLIVLVLAVLHRKDVYRS